MSKTKNEKFLTPAQAAESLGISVATLRKYSLIVEHTTGNGKFFERNSQNNRLYTAKNLEDFKKMVELGHGPKMTLESAAKQIYPTDTVEETTTDDKRVAELETIIEDLKAEAKKQAETIKELNQEITDLQASKDTLKNKVEEQESSVVAEQSTENEVKEQVNEQVQNDKKSHWWNRFVK